MGASNSQVILIGRAPSCLTYRAVPRQALDTARFLGRVNFMGY